MAEQGKGFLTISFTAVMAVTLMLVMGIAVSSKLGMQTAYADANTDTVLSGDVLDNVVVRIRPANSHKPISVDHDGSKGEDALHLFYLGHSTHFLFERVGNTNNYRIRYYDSFYTEDTKSNTCVDVGHGKDSDRMEEGAEVHIKANDSTSRSQQWQVIRTASNTYHIRNVYSGKALVAQQDERAKEG